MSTRILAPVPWTRLSWKSGGMTTPTRTRPAVISSRASCGSVVTLVMLKVCVARSWSISSRLWRVPSWSTTTVGTLVTV